MAAKTDPVIAIRNLHAGYGKLSILHGIDLDIHEKQFTAVLGPNGSGKSTLMKSMFGLAQVTRGSITLDGRELVGLPTESIGRGGIGYVPQRGNVFAAMSVRENLLLGVRPEDWHERASLLDEVHNLFPALKNRHNHLARQLSGGERQMLAIALGWLSRPKVMLLDEPTAGLSPLFTTEVFRTLQQLRDRVTLLVIEQNARSVLQWCDYVYFLREGRLTFAGTAQACLADEGIASTYLGIGTKRRRPDAQTEAPVLEPV